MLEHIGTGIPLSKQFKAIPRSECLAANSFKKASKVQFKPAAVISFLNPGFSFFINSHVTSSGVELLFLVTLFYLDIFSTIDCKYYFCQKKFRYIRYFNTEHLHCRDCT